MAKASEIREMKEDELELDLRLSIGGSFRNSPETRRPSMEFDSKTNGFDLDLKETQTTTSRSSSSPAGPSGELESPILDPLTKREIQALRRQEAKRKQQQKRSRGRNSLPLPDQTSDSPAEEQRERKREKKNGDGSEINAGNNVNSNSINGGPSVQFPIPAMQYPYPQPLQFVNGFSYPCVMPYWTPAYPGGERNVFQPVAIRGFRPFVAHRSFGFNLPNGFDSRQNGADDSETIKATSNSSPMCSSSTVSFSQDGDGSSETGSHSSHSLPNGNRNHPEAQSSFSHPSDSPPDNDHVVPSNDQSVPIEKPISKPETATPKMEVRKPPKPQGQNQNSTPKSTEMPCVSTTGDGPNGRTVTGFLHRYTKTEVSIVCVCHGSTFSPAEFVQHAGGTDISRPLRHITMIPSSFG
ncbi:hypothetical protein UlMin_031897 [Ulmus minor]